MDFSPTAGMQPSFLIVVSQKIFSSSFQLGRENISFWRGRVRTAFFDKGPKFLHYFPAGLILTSVEFDHADIYKDLDAVERLQAAGESGAGAGTHRRLRHRRKS